MQENPPLSLCKGCKGLVPLINGGNTMQCMFSRTHPNNLMIPNCPCQSCLIKAVCNEFCDDYMDLWHQDLKTYTRSIVFFKTGSKDELSEWQSCIK